VQGKSIFFNGITNYDFLIDKKVKTFSVGLPRRLESKFVTTTSLKTTQPIFFAFGLKFFLA
jgi:hypothetical protein